MEADLILHVRDISHAETEPQRRDVEAVLAGLDIEAAAADAPILEVWNKADRLSEAARSEAERGIARSERPPVLVSALTGEGIEALRTAIGRALRRQGRGAGPGDPPRGRPAAELAPRQRRGARARRRRRAAQ